jgi:hypothetical protein
MQGSMPLLLRQYAATVMRGDVTPSPPHPLTLSPPHSLHLVFRQRDRTQQPYVVPQFGAYDF